MKVRTTAVLGLFLLLIGHAFAQDVNVSYNHGTNFSKFKTYAWGKMQSPNQIKHPRLAKEVQNQVNAQMQAKGLTMVQLSQNPDVIVTASGASKEQTFYSNWDASGTVFTAGTDNGVPSEELMGALVVDLYDVNAKHLVWRGTATGILNQKSFDKNKELVDKAVVKMFQQYPSFPAM